MEWSYADALGQLDAGQTACPMCSERHRDVMPATHVGADGRVYCEPCVKYVARRPLGDCTQCGLSPRAAATVLDGLAVCKRCSTVMRRRRAVENDGQERDDPEEQSPTRRRRGDAAMLGDITNLLGGADDGPQAGGETDAATRPVRKRRRPTWLSGHDTSGPGGIHLPTSASQDAEAAETVRREEAEARRRVEAAEHAERVRVESAAAAERARTEMERQRELAAAAKRERDILTAEKRFQADYARRVALPDAPCLNCREQYPGQPMRRTGMCQRCSGSEHAALMWSAANRMDPGEVPPALQSLTEAERMLIARATPIMKVHVAPKGQLRYTGHTLFLEQRIERIASKLPRAPADCPVLVMHRRPACPANDGDPATEPGLKVRVRRERVLQALLWLRNNNPYYRDVEMDEEALALLPVDDEVEVGGVFAVEEREDGAAGAGGGATGPAQGPNGDEADPGERESMLPPGAGAGLTEREELARAAAAAGAAPGSNATPTPLSPFVYPENGEEALDEWGTEGLFTMAFPHQFPHGEGDISTLRDVSVKLGEWGKHLINYHDGRFADDPRLRYVLLNMIQRRQLQQTGMVFVRKHGLGEATVEDLRDLLNNADGGLNKLADSAMRFTGSLRGSRAYWVRCGKELRLMVRQLGNPAVFLTLSCADMHSPEFEPVLNPPNRPHIATRPAAVIQRPDAVVRAFHARVQALVDKVLTPLFGLEDFWYRYEMQQRGSVHLHGVLWLRGQPVRGDGPTLPNAELETAIKAFFDRSGGGVDVGVQGGCGMEVVARLYEDALPTADAPSARTPEQIRAIGVQADFEQLVNATQAHRCYPTYCLVGASKRVARGRPACRFEFPLPPADKYTIVYNANRGGQPELVVPRRPEDARGARYNPILTRIWRANTDVSPVLDMPAVLRYVAKYIAKPEVASTACREVFGAVVDQLDDTAPAVRAIRRLMNTAAGEHDYAAQEVMLLLLTIPLHSSSRTTVTARIGGTGGLARVRGTRLQQEGDEVWDPEAAAYRERDDEDEEHRGGAGGADPDEDEDEDEDEGRGECAWVRTYIKRKPVDNTLTLREFMKTRTTTGTPRRGKDAIVGFSPYLPALLEDDDAISEQWAEQRLLIDTPWRDRVAVRGEHATWVDALNAAAAHAPHLLDDVRAMRAAREEGRRRPVERNPDGDEDNDEDEADEDMAHQPPRVQELWMQLAGQPHRPRAPGERDAFGARDGRPDIDWEAAYQVYDPEDAARVTAAVQQASRAAPGAADTGPPIDPATLQGVQRELYDLCAAHDQAFRDGAAPAPLRLVVSGTAGTGKSYVLGAIRQHLGPAVAVVAAPTGAAARNIGGSTLHSLLAIPAKKGGGDGVSPLKDARLLALQETFADVRYLVIDEKSMVGARVLAAVDARLRQAYPARSDQPFGGVSVILVGDFGQLPPVGDAPVFSTTSAGAAQPDAATAAGRAAYRSFFGAFQLEQVHRQAGDEQAQFRTLLAALHDGGLDREQWQLLCTRRTRPDDPTIVNLPRLYANAASVLAYNLERLHRVCPDAAVVRAEHSDGTAGKAATDLAGGLPVQTYLGTGATVMLTANLAVQLGLVNGARGTVVAVVYAPGTAPPALPVSVVVRFEGYTGPSLAAWPGCVPIAPLKRTWTDHDGTTRWRLQVPLVLAWAVTIHKSQGMSLDGAALDAGEKEFAAGLTFVGVSRVRTLAGLHLIGPTEHLNLSRFQQLGGKAGEQRLREDARLRALSTTTSLAFHQNGLAGVLSLNSDALSMYVVPPPGPARKRGSRAGAGRGRGASAGRGRGASAAGAGAGQGRGAGAAGAGRGRGAGAGRGRWRGGGRV